VRRPTALCSTAQFKDIRGNGFRQFKALISLVRPSAFPCGSGMISIARGHFLSRDLWKSSTTKWSGDMSCAVCQKEIQVSPGAGRPRKYCSKACRQRAYRERRESFGCLPRPATIRLPSGRVGTVVAVVVIPAAVADDMDQRMVDDPGFDVKDLLLGVTQHLSPRDMFCAQSPDPSSGRSGGL